MTQVAQRIMTSRGAPTLQPGDDSDAPPGLRPRATVLVVDDDPDGERLEQVEVRVVMGSDRNIKITKPSDMDLARLFLAEELSPRVSS